MFADRGRNLCALGIIILALGVTGSQDPCLDGNAFTLDYLRKRSPSFVMDSAPLCDRYLREAWYRTEGYVMSTSPPSLTYCGTLYPVWLSGTIPQYGMTETLTACEVGFSRNCTRSYSIDVKNCTHFLVYKLKPLNVCNSGYCFELDDDCINQTVTNVTVKYHNITWTRTESDGEQYNVLHDPSINLLCSFTPSDDDTLLYHIDWYVDNDTVIRGQTVDKASLQDAILSAADLNNAGKKINCWIHCVVGIKQHENKHPCFSNSSELFFAGFEVLNSTLTIERKGTATLLIRPTIPYASEIYEDKDGKQTPPFFDIGVSVLEDSKCQEKISGSLSSCTVNISGFNYNDRHMYEVPANWNRIYSINVSNTDDKDYYLEDHRLVLRLQASGANGIGAQIFSNAVFPDVHINVVEKQTNWKGKVCKSHGDPYQTTFDGLYHICQATGCVVGNTYIMYQNEKHLQEVQVRHASCSWGRCVCAVAVRAGQDVFTIDLCSGRQFINFPVCNENSIKVIKELDKNYEIILPTGTTVKVQFVEFGDEIFFLDVDIYPTVADFLQTSGLCGTLDSNQTNDLRHRDGTLDDINSEPYDRFSLSWKLRIGSSEDLLSYSKAVYDNLRPLSSYYHKLCVCEMGKTYCSYKFYSECKTEIKGKEYHCMLQSSSRKKRDIFHLTTFINPQKSIKRVKRETFSEIDAFDICNEAFQQSSYYATCYENVPNFNNETLVNCISDLTLTGIRTLTQWHLNTALWQCQTFIRLNSSILSDNSSDTLDIINVCLNNCSNKGDCYDGKCICETGFGGSDCSFDVISPPTITRLSDDGICDKSEEACDAITLYGYYFLENMKTKCYFIREKVNPSESVELTASYIVSLEERTLYEGYCSLQYGQEAFWITKFSFNLSNDDTQFSDTYLLYIYQSKCQTYHNDSGRIYFTLQSGYCFINGNCIQVGKFKSDDICWQCKPQIALYNWTLELDCYMLQNSTDTTTQTSIRESTEKTKENTQYTYFAPQTIGLIVAAAVVPIILCLTVTVLIKKCIGHKNAKYDVNATGKTQVNIYPENNRCNTMRDTINPAYLWHFESSNDKYYRPPSTLSMPSHPETNDLTKVYSK